jgi:hypothetical protein
LYGAQAQPRTLRLPIPRAGMLTRPTALAVPQAQPPALPTGPACQASFSNRPPTPDAHVALTSSLPYAALAHDAETPDVRAHALLSEHVHLLSSSLLHFPQSPAHPMPPKLSPSPHLAISNARSELAVETTSPESVLAVRHRSNLARAPAPGSRGVSELALAFTSSPSCVCGTSAW